MREVRTGNFGVFRPGGDHDAIYVDKNLYLTLTLSEDRLTAAAEREGLVLDAVAVRGSGMYPGSFSPWELMRLRRKALALHRGAMSDAEALARFRALALAAFVKHSCRPPLVAPGLPPIRRHERIVARAREYIDQNLDQPIRIDALAEAAGASRRSLERAFLDVLDESPQAYVTRMRLHRIRADLVGAPARRIAHAANRWGFGELGRMSADTKRYSANCPRKPCGSIGLGRCIRDQPSRSEAGAGAPTFGQREGRRQSIATITSDALMTADAGFPTSSPSASTASLVMEAVTTVSGPISIFTCAVVTPLVMATTLPERTLRAENLMDGIPGP
jgi:AraC-like DNA-binding protein